MTTDTVTLFLALLSVVAEVTVAATVLLHVAERLSPTAARWKLAFVDAIGPQALVLAFLVAVISMSGSLYFSEAAHFTPCKLCWYQFVLIVALMLTRAGQTRREVRLERVSDADHQVASVLTPRPGR